MALTDFGFEQEIVFLHCRVCKRLILKVNYAKLLNVDIKYGICKKWTHGASLIKV